MQMWALETWFLFFRRVASCGVGIYPQERSRDRDYDRRDSRPDSAAALVGFSLTCRNRVVIEVPALWHDLTHALATSHSCYLTSHHHIILPDIEYDSTSSHCRVRVDLDTGSTKKRARRLTSCLFYRSSTPATVGGPSRRPWTRLLSWTRSKCKMYNGFRTTGDLGEMRKT